jgi:uncharacterized protein DUF6011
MDAEPLFSPADHDLMRYDPAVDRELVREKTGLVLKLGHECNTPLYALDELALCVAQDKPERWKHRVSWSFGMAAHPKDRLIVKPRYTWNGNDPDPVLREALWTPAGYRLELARFHVGPEMVHGKEMANFIAQAYGVIEFATHRVRLVSRDAWLEADLLAVAEVIETLRTDPATVFARSGGWGSCCFCGKHLSEPVSKRVGYGPDCAKKLQLAHGATASVLTP